MAATRPYFLHWPYSLQSTLVTSVSFIRRSLFVHMKMFVTLENSVLNRNSASDLSSNVETMQSLQVAHLATSWWSHRCLNEWRFPTVKKCHVLWCSVFWAFIFWPLCVSGALSAHSAVWKQNDLADITPRFITCCSCVGTNIPRQFSVRIQQPLLIVGPTGVYLCTYFSVYKTQHFPLKNDHKNRSASYTGVSYIVSNFGLL
jgi:hypothetical protein